MRRNFVYELLMQDKVLLKNLIVSYVMATGGIVGVVLPHIMNIPNAGMISSVAGLFLLGTLISSPAKMSKRDIFARLANSTISVKTDVAQDREQDIEQKEVRSESQPIPEDLSHNLEHTEPFSVPTTPYNVQLVIFKDGSTLEI